MEELLRDLINDKELKPTASSNIQYYVSSLVEGNEVVLSVEDCLKLLKVLSTFTKSDKLEWILVGQLLKSLEKLRFVVPDSEMLLLLTTLAKKMKVKNLSYLESKFTFKANRQ